MTLEKILHCNELWAKTMRGTTTMILEPTQAFIIRDKVGFIKFRILMGAEGEDAQLWLNGRQVLE